MSAKTHDLMQRFAATVGFIADWKAGNPADAAALAQIYVEVGSLLANRPTYRAMITLGGVVDGSATLRGEIPAVLLEGASTRGEAAAMARSWIEARRECYVSRVSIEEVPANG